MEFLIEKLNKAIHATKIIVKSRCDMTCLDVISLD